MASEHLISIIKQQANNLQTGLNFFDHSIKHTQALEFISRHLYGYPSWNVASGNSEDKTVPTKYQDLTQQVAALCNIIPELQVSETDLDFVDGQPGIMFSNRFREAAKAIATLFLDREPHNLIWEELLMERYVSEEMFAVYPEALRPKSLYEKIQYAKFNIEYQDHDPKDWPWDTWQAQMKAKGEIEPNLISWARDAYREAKQHSWGDDLLMFCGYFDQGIGLEAMLMKWPEKSLKTIRYLMETDAGITFLNPAAALTDRQNGLLT